MQFYLYINKTKPQPFHSVRNDMNHVNDIFLDIFEKLKR